MGNSNILYMNLSIIIPSRNEEFLQNTIDDIALHAKGDTEILVGLDGWYPKLTLPNIPIRFSISSEPIGQRAMQNRLVKMSTAKYIMKVDAHCSFSNGFDVEMMKLMDSKTVLTPLMFQLHAYDWLCECGKRQYQGVMPPPCHKWTKDIKWEIKPKPFYTNFFFDSNLIFGYCPKQSEESLTETMAIQGSGFMVDRKTYWKWNLCDESFTSWGFQGAEVSLKTWLSGGRVLTTRDAYYGHLFRGLEEFPYQRDMKDVEHAKDYCHELFLKGKWKGEKSLAWLVRKFNYPGDWTEEKLLGISKKFD